MKKIITVLLSAAVLGTCSFLPVRAVGVLPYEFDERNYSDFTRIDNIEPLIGQYEFAYLLGNSTIRVIKRTNDYINFTAVSNAKDEISSALAEFDKEYVISASSSLGSSDLVEYNLQSAVDNSISTQEAKELCEMLKEKNLIRDCYFSIGMYWHQDVSYMYPTCYEILGSYEETEALLSEFKKRNNINGEIVYEKAEAPLGMPVVYFYPENELTTSEHFSLSSAIAYETGLIPVSFVPENGLTITQIEIDLFNSVSGDANSDTSANIADAVAVLQYLANEEKYPLTPQGIFNADVDGSDGLTGADATVIQMIDAGAF
ncbi:MAG: dockerin type I repeat-containing protein [Ruminococcus sp.]|nr:dockerin type I repeat-containing protein [Ruminococcus sp.]